MVKDKLENYPVLKADGAFKKISFIILNSNYKSKNY